MAEEQVNEHRYTQDAEYFEALDKRSKEYKSYKQWKQNFEKENSVGLGDVVEKVTKATGIKKLVKFVAGEDCGCDKRQKQLNKIKVRFPVTKCFNEDYYNKWSNFVKKSKRGNEWINITHQDQIEVMIPIYAHLFNRSIPKPVSCCADGYLNDIHRVYEQYQ